VVKDIIICGLADPEIRRDVLELPDLDKKSTIDLVSFIEGKEVARKAWSTASPMENAAFSEKRVNKEDPLQSKLSMKTSCSVCGMKMSQFARNRFGRINKTAFTECAKCYKESTSERALQAYKSEQAAIQGFICSMEVQELDEEINQPTAMTPTMKAAYKCIEIASGESRGHIQLDHHIFTCWLGEGKHSYASCP